MPTQKWGNNDSKASWHALKFINSAICLLSCIFQGIPFIATMQLPKWGKRQMKIFNTILEGGNEIFVSMRLANGLNWIIIR